MKVWITKYALTQGIWEKDARVCHNISEDMISLEENEYNYFHKPFWHDSQEDAIAHAEQMRIKKIASHRKQIAKLEAMKF